MLAHLILGMVNAAACQVQARLFTFGVSPPMTTQTSQQYWAAYHFRQQYDSHRQHQLAWEAYLTVNINAWGPDIPA